MNIKIKVGFSIILLSLTSYLYSENLPTLQEALSFLDNKDIQTLTDTGELTIFHGDTFTPQNIPNCELKDVMSKEYGKKDVNLGIESIFLYKDLDLEDLEQNTDKYLHQYYNILNSVSTLEGIDYWSASRDRYRTLFTESWIIDNLEDQNRIQDPIDSVIPPRKSLFIHQENTTFGKGQSELTYLYSKDSIRMNILNKTNIYYTIVKVVDKDKLSIDLLLVPTQSGLLYYGLITSKTIKIKAIQKKASVSFYNRIVAFNTWLIDHIEND